GGQLQPVRLRDRAVGHRFPEAADHPADGGDAVDLPRRRLLLDRDAAAVLAEGGPVQPGGLPDQRLPLELLRPVRRQCGGELRRYHRLPGAVPGAGAPGVHDRLAAEGLSPGSNGSVKWLTPAADWPRTGADGTPEP